MEGLIPPAISCREETSKNIRWLGGSFFLIVCATLILAAVVFKQAIIQFCLFYLNYLLILLGGPVFRRIARSPHRQAAEQRRNLSKGRMPKKGMYFTTMVGEDRFPGFFDLQPQYGDSGILPA